MTVVKGLREALVLFVVAGLVALLGAVAWHSARGGDLVQRLGFTLMIVGALLGVTGDLTLSRIGTMESRAMFGHAPEQEGAGGGRVLTGVGIFLFVSVPLIALGLLLVS
ncbi:hypothetical protein V6U81_16225 [Micromonospora sp. CPCC 205711]|uniref:hypothetical protein n=1 Tax=Micromonospora sp. CPCC 205547 TaxID=3122400 RepID=UPI002FF2E2C4